MFDELLDDLFDDDTARRRQLSAKADLLDHRHEDVFSALPNSTAASVEVLKMITGHLVTNCPDISLNVDPSLHPLEAAARLLPEDLLLLAPCHSNNGTPASKVHWRLIAGALCFPAHWVLKKKMNKPLTEIHEPVPHYAEVLGNPVERFFNSMKIGPISMRMNWSLQANDALYAPVRLHQPDWIPGVNHDQIYLRVERQTFRKLARSGHILFTIRTYLTPVSTWRDNDEAIEDLLSALGDMSPEMRHYKGAVLYEDSLRKMLVKP